MIRVPTDDQSTQQTTPGLDDLLRRFDHALHELHAAPGFAKPRYQTEIQQIATDILGTPGGIKALDERAPLFEEAGVFTGGPWEDASRLSPPLVGGTLKAGGLSQTMETLSDLRMVAIATGRATNDNTSEEEAMAYLERITSLNLALLFGPSTEAERAGPAFDAQAASGLFRHILRNVPVERLVQRVVNEIEEICVQRPIWTHQVRKMIRLVAQLPDTAPSEDPALGRFVDAITGPTPLSRTVRDPLDYRKALKEMGPDRLTREIEDFATSLRSTGLAAEQHAVLVRHLARTDITRVADALGLDDRGRAELEANQDLTGELVRVAIHPTTCQTLYGLARILERGLLSRPAVAGGLRRLIDLSIRAEVRKVLLATRDRDDGTTANEILVAGTIRVLGQPLGVGQGNNPTCQAARGISMWSQHRPGYLLELIARAARDGVVEIAFEGDLMRSDELGPGLAPHLDPELDPVSLTLVPHLDSLYDEMMKRVAMRTDDGHRWVNPGLYGRIVPSGFSSAIDKVTGTVTNYRDFVRLFYASHHPHYNDGHTLIYPNPVGLLITTTQGVLLGFHAVSLQRVAPDPSGTLRAYFFNPNNEGRQDWGQKIRTSVKGHGEHEGESSLPFHQFASRLYAYHYDPYEVGDTYAVPEKSVEEVERLARESWGRQYPWLPDPRTAASGQP